MSWIVESKLHPNTPNEDVIERPRLLSLLDGAIDKKLVLLRAPAGYGKSTLIGQWYANLDKNQVHAAWLTLDVPDSEEKQFLAYFVLALDSSGVKVGNLMTGARNGFEGWIQSEVIKNLVVSLNSPGRKCVVVLEDYHSAECAGINEIVMRLLREVSTNLCLVVDSRTLPELDALSLMVSGTAIEIPASQLKLTQEETSLILGDAISKDQAQTVFTQTEGWMMAVQLAKLQQKTRPEESASNLAGGHFIPLYLTKQVLSGLGKNERSVLLAVSVLKRFNASLAAHISDQEEGLNLINQLHTLSPLIVSLDSRGGWYRLHHLFASYLRELLAQNPNKPNLVRLKASEWHVQQGDIAIAVRYAADAEDYHRCHEIINEAGGWRIILSSSIGILRAALRSIPVEKIDHRATTLIAKAYLHCKDGEIPEARAALERSWSLDQHKPESLEIDRLVVEAMIGLYEDRDQETAVFIDLKERYFNARRLPPLEYATVVAGETVKQIVLADFDAARTALQSAFESMRESGSVLGLNYCYIHAAQIALYQGNMDLAYATVRRALVMADENFGSDSGLKNIAQVLHYSVLAWSGKMTEDLLPSFERALIHAMEFDGWTEIYMLGLDAFVLVAMRFNLESRAVSVLKRFHSHASFFNLDRLGSFVESLLSLLYFRDNSLGVITSLLFTTTHNMDATLALEGSRDWLVRIKSVGLLPLRAPEANWPRQFDQASVFLQQRKLILQEILLMVNKTWLLQNSGQIELAKEAMVDAVKMAASRKIMGPFITSKSLLQLLDQIKSNYRQSDNEIIEYNFVTDILGHARCQNNSASRGLLSDRELEVLKILAQGKSNKEIARDLELTENTVKFHLKQIFSKLEVGKRTQAIIEARKLGLLD